MISYTVYIVDDEKTIREGVTMALEDLYRIKEFADAETALSALEQDPPDLVLLDVGLPGMDGIEALRRIREFQPDVLIIMITAYEDVDTVVAAMKSGAYDYVVKPIHMDGLEVTIRNAIDTIRLRKEVQALQERYIKEHIPCFIGESNAIQDVMEFVKTVAQSPDTPIIIIGETGTGKELLASAIHYNSPNFKAPFTTVNCAAIPKDLIESELFGYEKGAFSGAGAAGKKGLIEEAANGTLFLDEVGDLSLEAQAKLLRFLELGEYYRVGSTQKHHISTRVISATNKDLGQKFGKKYTGISLEAEAVLLAHNWTGHVRELKNLVERAVLTGKGSELLPVDLGLESHSQDGHKAPDGDQAGFPPLPSEGLDLDAQLQSFEKHYIEAALKIAKGNESKAAKLLNINHHTFRYRTQKLLGE